MTDEQKQALWNEACKDTPQAPGWNRHIRYATSIEAAATAPLLAKIAELEAKLAQLVPTDSMGIPVSCGKPLCSPGDHHPLCAQAPNTQQAEQQTKRCPNCDDTGDVISIDGEWRGTCHCPAGQASNAQAAQKEAQEPVEYQFQDRNGKWRGFLDEQHKLNTIADGTWPIRPLFTRPKPAQHQLCQGEQRP